MSNPVPLQPFVWNLLIPQRNSLRQPHVSAYGIADRTLLCRESFLLSMARMAMPLQSETLPTMQSSWENSCLRRNRFPEFKHIGVARSLFSWWRRREFSQARRSLPGARACRWPATKPVCTSTFLPLEHSQ